MLNRLEELRSGAAAGRRARVARADGNAREWVLACIDDSSYANSVTDHAGWFASHPEVGVDLLHVPDQRDRQEETEALKASLMGDSMSDALVDRAVWRLREEGVGPIRVATEAGALVEIVARHEAGPIVIGKRGAGSMGHRGRLGSEATAILNSTDKPVCLAPKVFLPIHRALVVLDAEIEHRSALEFLSSDFRLSALPLNVAIVARSGEDGDAKLEWARARLSGCSAEIFSVLSPSIDDAVTLCMEARGTDMLILSRTAVDGELMRQVRQIEERTLWGTRTPVLIC